MKTSQNLPFWPDPKSYRDIDLDLSRVKKLLTRLVNPHLKIPPTIHIAGTNGKGSTLSFLRTIFEESGLKIHSYTSPHLVKFNERIVLAGKEISDETLREVLLECQAAAEKRPKISVTFFEGITAASFLAFSRSKADLLLLETGMGGRLDATNILPEVLCSVITPIALDHQEFLGKTLAKIAYEKAGIIKKNCPTIVGRQKPSARRVIENTASGASSEVRFFGKDWEVKKQRNGFLFSGFGRKISLPLPSLLGDHQIENAALAIAAALTQKKFLISENHLRAGITKIFWPARLQKINSGNFFEMLPKNYALFLDGSHNLQGAGTIKKFLETQKNKKIFVIFTMLQDKNCEGFLKKISGEIDLLIALSIPNEPKSRAAAEVKKIAEKIGINAVTAKNFDEAFAVCLREGNGDETALLVCGSLYLAGEFLKLNNER